MKTHLLPADTRWSALGFCLVSTILLPWMLTYSIGGDAVFGKQLFHSLDASRLRLADYGVPI